MLKRLIEAVRPDVSLSAPARLAWAAAIVLFPVALVLGFLLLLRTEPKPAVQVTLDSTRATQLARSYLIGRGIAAGSWNAVYGVSDEQILLKFINAKASRRSLWKLAPPLQAVIRFSAPTGGESAQVYLSLDGRVTGFEWTDFPPPSGALPPVDALGLAQAQLPPEVHFGQPSVETKGADRIYKFRSSQVAEVELTAEVHISGNRVSFSRLTADPNQGDRWDTGNGLEDGLIIAGLLFACLVGLFSIYRYASRTMEREVSHKRSLLVASLCGGFFALIASNAIAQGKSGNLRPAILFLVFAVIGFVAGAILAAAYGSGEGDVREAFPGKLTSLDALLTGRLFSRVVGVSVLFGLVCVGWLILSVAIVISPFRPAEALGSEAMLQPFTHWGWLMLWVTCPLIALSITAAGLLQPLAFLNRYAGRARRWHLPILIGCGALVASIRGNSSSKVEFFAQVVAIVAALTIPFFCRDLLATLVCVGSYFYVTTLVKQIAAVPSETVTPALHFALGLVMLIFAVASALFGKKVVDEQVRPLYARHVEQRKALEAEVSAAREAQLRLLPQSAPDFAGLSIAASCIPAETVGGDFYDFFSLADGRLGLFIADGNNRGLAAALTIALAKGYLMQSVAKFRDPLDILVRLEAALNSIFAGSASSESASSAANDFAFAAIDTARGEIRYARTGIYPKVVIAPSPDSLTERLVAVEGRNQPMVEGFAKLAPGDHILLFTDGIGRRLGMEAQSPPEGLLKVLRMDHPKDAEEMRKRVMAASKSSSDPDDLTIVVVQVQSVGASALEGAA